MKAKKKAWLINGARTPIGSLGKSLRSTTADKLASHAMQAALRRSGVEATEVDEVILGHGFQSGFTPNTARGSATQAGVPDNAPALTVQRQCGSGMEAANLAVEKIWLDKADLVLAGGTESMSTVPFILPGKLRWDGWQNFLEKRVGIPRMGPRLSPLVGPLALALVVTVIGLIASIWSGTLAVTALAVSALLAGYGIWRGFGEMADNGIAPRVLLSDMRTVFMSGTAQRLADTYGIDRADADAFALRSQERAHAAITSGRFDVEIEPIETPRGFFSRDEHARGVKSESNPRGSTLQSLKGLRGVMKTRDITAGNSSGINDGACALVIASDEKVHQLGVQPLAELVDHAVAGVDAEQMGIGPVEAINKLLAQNNLTLADIDLIEINEAFAAQYLACEKLLGLDREKVNVNGGAIALGHPIAMSGARLILTLAHELKLRGKKRGIAALCIGGGMGIATLIENPDVA